MSEVREAAYWNARKSQIIGWTVFAILVVLAYRQYLWGDFALLAGAIWIAYYYTRFTTAPADVADARNGVVMLGLFLVALLANGIEQRGRRIDFVADLKALCSDAHEEESKSWEKCDELLNLVDRMDDGDYYDDWVAGT